MRTEFAQCIVDLLVIHGHLWEILFGEQRYSPDQPRDEHGKWVSSGTGSTAKGVDKSKKDDIINLEDEYVSHSIGAKRKSFDIMDLKTGEHFDLVDGTYIRDKKIFAGKGSSTPYRKAYVYANKHHNAPEEWSHVKGFGTVDYYGEAREAELHWSECKGIGKEDIFIKRWLDES